MRSGRFSIIVNKVVRVRDGDSAIARGSAAGAILATIVLALGLPASATPAAPVAAAKAHARTHCLDSFLAVGQGIARPIDVALGRPSNPKPDFVIRTDLLVAPQLAKTPLVGFLYVTRESNAFFSTRERKNIDPAVLPIVRELYAASTTATSTQLDTLLARQNGNAVVFLPRALALLRSLKLRAAPCVVLAKTAKTP